MFISKSFQLFIVFGLKFDFSDRVTFFFNHPVNKIIMARRHYKILQFKDFLFYFSALIFQNQIIKQYLHKMNMKVLIQTLIQIPDLQLLTQLSQIVKKDQALNFSDVRKYYQMFAALYEASCYRNSKNPKQTDIRILLKAIELNIVSIEFLLITEIQSFWKVVSSSLISMLGQENQAIRQQSRIMILIFLRKTNNLPLICQSLYEKGIQSNKQESFSVIIHSTKLLGKILDQNSQHALITSSSQMVYLLKNIIEQMIRNTKKDHLQLSKVSHEFLIRIFHMKIARIEQVLERLGEVYSFQLQKIWSKERQVLLQKPKVENQLQSNSTIQYLDIKYEHLPIINGKMLGQFQPFVFKHIFNPQSPSTFKYAVSQLKEIYFQKQDKLINYISVIYKIILYLINKMAKAPQNVPISHCIQVLQLLERILQITGVNKFVQLQYCCEVLIQDLHTENVIYRRALRSNLKRLNFLTPKKNMQIYSRELQKNVLWVKRYQILLLTEHWIENIDDSQYQTLSDLIKIISKSHFNSEQKSNAKIATLQEKLFIMILEKYPAYRQVLQDVLNPTIIDQIEDILQSRKNGTKIPRADDGKQAQQTFMQQYHEQRQRYNNYQKNLKKKN